MHREESFDQGPIRFRLTFLSLYSTQHSLTIFGKKIQELITSTNKKDIEFIKITDETVTASLNAVAHMVFSKERFMTKSEVIEANEPNSSIKNTNSTQN